MSSPPPGPVLPVDEAVPPGKGCWKKGLIGCGAVALLVALGLIGIIVYMRRNPQTMTDMMMKQVETHYAADVTAEEKERLRSAYGDFKRALAQDRVPRHFYEDLRRTLLSGGTNSDVTREQVRELTDLFRRGAGAPSPPPVSTPVVSPKP